MSEVSKQRFVEGRTVYVVDCWGTKDGMQAFEAAALIVGVEDNCFHAVLYGDTYQTYSYNDYGRLIFFTKTEAETEAEKLPKPGSMVYQIHKNGNISRYIVKGIRDCNVNGITNLYMEFTNKKPITTDKIGKVIFLTEEDAQKAIQGKKSKPSV